MPVQPQLPVGGYAREHGLERQSSTLFRGCFGGFAAKTTTEKRFLGGLRPPNPATRILDWRSSSHGCPVHATIGGGPAGHLYCLSFHNAPRSRAIQYSNPA